MNGKIRVLLVDDNPNDRLLESRLICKEVPEAIIIEVRSITDFESELAKGEFDVAITDYHLVWANGLDLLRQIRGRYADKPVIMVTGTGNEEIAVEAMKAGLYDYIIKTTKHINKLPAVVRSALGHFKAREHSLRLETRLENVLNILNVGIFTLNKEGWVTEASNHFYEMMAPFENDLHQINLISYIKDDDGLPIDIGTIMDGKVHRGLKFHIRKGDEEAWMLLNMVSEEYYDGKRIVQGMMENITSQMRIEKERDEAFRQVEMNLQHFSFLSDRLRNPLTVILIAADGLVGHKKEQITEASLQMKEVLDVMDKDWSESELLRHRWQEKYQKIGGNGNNDN